MKFMGMEHPALHKVAAPATGNKKRKIWISADLDKNGNLVDRKITECDRPLPVQGYRIDKLGLGEPLFTRKYSRAVDLLCCAIFENGIFTGKSGAKIEAVR